MTDTPPFSALIDATWPAAEYARCGPFQLRRGAGGGSRVSAASALGPVTGAEIDAAAAGMREWGQTPLFMVRAKEDTSDTLLAERGYVVQDPVVLYSAPVADLADLPLPPVTSFQVWPPLAAQREIWADGGIGPARLAVMSRVTGPKTTLMGRSKGAPSGAAFVAAFGEAAMLHALEVRAEARRQGLGRFLMIAAARWAKGAGAKRLDVLVTEVNPARALYEGLGMTLGPGYHYRRAGSA